LLPSRLLKLCLPRTVKISLGQQQKMKILCIQLKQLGDVLMSTAAVRALAQTYPGCQIDAFVSRP